MGRAFKKKIFTALKGDYPIFLINILDNPLKKAVNVLFSALLSKDDKIKWHAVVAFGAVVGRIAKEDMEGARVIMRRCMWMLNDESGGIGWGIPEAMSESMVNSRKLFEEYHKVFLSYLFEDEMGRDNFLEFLPLRRGGFWGLARLCNTYPNDFSNLNLPSKLLKLINHEKDDFIKVYMLLALKGMNCSFSFLPELSCSVTIFWDNKFLKVERENLGGLL